MTTMSATTNIVTTANEAVAKIAYALNELCVIYPITPASGMSEEVEAMSADEQTNIWGDVPRVVQMQSEAGVAATTGLDFDPVRGHRTIRFSFARSEAEIEDGIRRLQTFLG